MDGSKPRPEIRPYQEAEREHLVSLGAEGLGTASKNGHNLLRGL